MWGISFINSVLLSRVIYSNIKTIMPQRAVAMPAHTIGRIFLFKMSEYLSTPATAAAAIMLNRQTALPKEAPLSCIASITSYDNDRLSAALYCTGPKITLETVVLPVMNVPVTPIKGLMSGYMLPVFANNMDIASTIDGISVPLDSISLVIPSEGNKIIEVSN